MTSGAPQHVCFYSKNCDWSKAFIRELKQTPYISEIKFICVDGQGRELQQKYPWLKKVPTLVVRGEAEPRTDGNVMNWLSERRLLGSSGGGMQRSSEPAFRGSGGGSAQQSVDRVGYTQQSGSGVSQNMDAVEPWIPGEMGGNLTKSFSFIDANEAPIHNFEYLNGAAAPGVRTASDMPGGGLGARAQTQKSKKEELFDKQMETYMRERGQGMPPPINRQ